MSYAEKLYDNIQLANNHALLGKKALEELILFFRSLVSADESYAKSLEGLSNFQFLILRGSMFEAASTLKRDISNKAVQLRAFTDNILCDIIKPLQSILTYSMDQAKTLSTEASRVVKFKDSYYDKLNRFKEKFWKSCSECEKITQLLEQPQTQTTREKFLQKLIKQKNLLDLDLKTYQEHIDHWEEFTNSFRLLIWPILEGYEKNETTRLESTKDQLRKYVVYQTSYIRNLQYEIDSLAKCMENLDTAKDLEVMIQSSTKTIKPEFEAYKGVHSAYRKINASGLLFSIPLPIQDSKWSEIVFQGSIEEMYKTEIDIITLKACQGYELTSEDFVQFNSLIKDSLGRKAWIWSMNGKKTQPLLSDKGYLQLGELMLSVLNEVICK